jgi:hypothetical protein
MALQNCRRTLPSLFIQNQKNGCAPIVPLLSLAGCDSIQRCGLFFQLTIFAFDADDGNSIRMIASQQIRTKAANPASHNPRIKLAGL